MENIIKNLIANLSQEITKAELFSYFSVEIFCVIGIIVNIILFLFFKRKLNIRRLSDVTTFCIFVINFLISSSIFIKNKLLFGDFSPSVIGGGLVFDNQNLLFQIFINLFFILYILSTYKLTRKARYNVTLVNSSLLTCSLFSLILIKLVNPIIAFITLDITSFYIYKSASVARFKKDSIFSPNFIAISLISTILFYLFFASSFIVKEEIQMAVVGVCLSCAIILKAGLFPVYNYSLTRCDKNNLPFSILLYNYLPFLGIVTFTKFIQNIDYSNKIYFLAFSAFLATVIFTCAIYSFKTKNINRYLANCFYIYSAIHIAALLTLPNNAAVINSLLMFTFAFLAINSLLCVIKINFKNEKINLSLLKGFFIKNRKFCAIFSILLLIIANIIPSALLISNYNIVKNLLLQNAHGSLLTITFLFAYLLIALSTLKIIKNLYSKKDSLEPLFVLTKRTTLNYVVPLIILLFLITKMFL